MTRLEDVGQPPQDVLSTGDSFEQRWAHWRARGEVYASQTRRRMIAITVSACLGGAAFWAWAALSVQTGSAGVP